MFEGYVRVTLMDSIRMSVDQERSSSNRSASAALAFNTPESARPPAALSTPPKRTPPRSEAFRKGSSDYNFFATVDYAHIPECYRKTPQPEEHILADPNRLGEWHNGTTGVPSPLALGVVNVLSRAISVRGLHCSQSCTRHRRQSARRPLPPPPDRRRSPHRRARRRRSATCRSCSSSM